MNLYRQKIYELTHWSHEARALAHILIKTYSDNHKAAYDVLVKITRNADRTKLLKYIDKPNMSKTTIKKIVDTYCFYHATLENNPKYKKWYKTNNLSLLDKEEDRLLLIEFVKRLNQNQK